MHPEWQNMSPTISYKQKHLSNSNQQSNLTSKKDNKSCVCVMLTKAGRDTKAAIKSTLKFKIPLRM